MKLHAGDHVCSVYDTDEQLVATVAGFLADGHPRGTMLVRPPRRRGFGDPIRHRGRGIDVAAALRRTALNLLDSNETYTVYAGFDPEETMRVCNNAIEESLNDGFKGFRAAAEMSWALDVDIGRESLVAYEALLRVLFSTARATGLSSATSPTVS
jgi:hypothetical protein